MPISALPPAPLPTDSVDVFNTKAFNLVAALAQFVTQANALETNVNSKEALATTAASTAGTARNEAVSAKDDAVAARNITTSARDVTLGYRNESEGFKNTASTAATTATAAAQYVEDIVADLEGGPVISVNGQTDIVTLGAADVGALPATGPIAVGGSVRAPRLAVPALAIDCSTGNYFSKTVAGNSAFTFSGAPAAGTAYAMSIDIAHTSGVISWPTSVKWPNDLAPTLTAGKVHKFIFTTSDGGVTWRGAALPNYAS